MFPTRSSTRWPTMTSCRSSSSRSFFGVALAADRRRRPRRSSTLLDSVAQVMFQFTGYVMYFAPIGVMAAIAATVGGKGLGDPLDARQAGRDDVCRAGAFRAHRRRRRGAGLSAFRSCAFFRAIREPFLIAFTTASSEAALPKALEVMERFGVPKHIVGFVLPTGYSFNLDGIDAVPVGRRDLRRAARRHRAVVRPADGDDADADADEQGRRRRATRGAGRADGHADDRSACRSKAPRSCSASTRCSTWGGRRVNVLGNCMATVVVARWEGEFDDRAGAAILHEVLSLARPGSWAAVGADGCRPLRAAGTRSSPLTRATID